MLAPRDHVHAERLVAPGLPPVPQTVMPCAVAAAMSIEALRTPVENRHIGAETVPVRAGERSALVVIQDGDAHAFSCVRYRIGT
jgi:hypothetical protein